MTCYYPRDAWKVTGGGRLVFNEKHDETGKITIPCGNCIGCRLERARQWAVRCMHEAQMHKNSEFVTLTYSEEEMPYGGNLEYKHFMQFMKDTRKKQGNGIKFYMCGEYGPKRARPHYHAILFGVEYKDKKPWRQTEHGTLWTSEELTKTWGRGMCTTGNVTFQSASYVAAYVMKKMNGRKQEETYRTVVEETGEVIQRTPEFNKMSLKPGIGKTWLEKWKTDCFPRDEVVMNGRKMKPPKYYEKLYKKWDAEAEEEMKYERYKKGIEHREEGTEERLRVREAVAKAKIRNNKRELA